MFSPSWYKINCSITCFRMGWRVARREKRQHPSVEPRAPSSRSPPLCGDHLLIHPEKLRLRGDIQGVIWRCGAQCGGDWWYSYGNSSLLSLRNRRLSSIWEGGLRRFSVETKPSVALSSPWCSWWWPRDGDVRIDVSLQHISVCKLKKRTAALNIRGCLKEVAGWAWWWLYTECFFNLLHTETSEDNFKPLMTKLYSLLTFEKKKKKKSECSGERPDKFSFHVRE